MSSRHINTIARMLSQQPWQYHQVPKDVDQGIRDPSGLGHFRDLGVGALENGRKLLRNKNNVCIGRQLRHTADDILHVFARDTVWRVTRVRRDANFHWSSPHFPVRVPPPMCGFMVSIVWLPPWRLRGERRRTDRCSALLGRHCCAVPSMYRIMQFLCLYGVASQTQRNSVFQAFHAALLPLVLAGCESLCAKCNELSDKQSYFGESDVSAAPAKRKTGYFTSRW